MNVAVETTEQPDQRASSLLRTLLLCDLVDSTGLVERLGDRSAAELIRKHDRLARTIADRHGGREIDKTDGFLMMFDRPIQAVAFGLDYQRGLKQLNAAENTTLSARVGIHVGDVVVWDNTRDDIAKGAKPVEVEGLVKPIASRLMSLALPGQILLSNIAYALAHRAQGELGIQLEKVRWRTHGRYRFRGIPDPVPVFEVGEDGVAPLKAPPWSSKAHREVPFWRRPATMVIEALVLVALVTIPVVMFVRPEPAIAFANRDWVVVGNLHNLTGETVFDEALESALRISLEQSRYVNVLPDLKVRDTVKRMERDPDTTRIDRVVGSEVAIRDGAKALILPTIAEIGGRVRITAEVIDPYTQTTVYSESADGTGAESVLPSLDTINSRLRVRLGEALATVSQDSLPLEKVATKNLDALRAYSLGNRNAALGEFARALEFYRQALVLDPGFASVHLRIAAIMVAATRAREAADSLQTALASRDRLSIRDAMYADVLLATTQSPTSALQKWSMLAESYPDYFPGIGGFAYVSWREANRFDDKVLAAAMASATSKNPTPTPSLHLVGILHVGRGEYDKASAAFNDAQAKGLVRTEYHAALYAAQRRFELAATTLAASPVDGPSFNPAVSTLRNIFETIIALDQGSVDEARKRLQRAISDASASPNIAGAYSIASATIARDAVSRRERLRVLSAELAAVKSRRSATIEAEHPALDAGILMLAYLAASDDEPALADQALEVVGSGASASLLLGKLEAVVRAERERSAGEANAAIGRLEKQIDGSELYLTHVALMDALARAQRNKEALQQARWLTAHRGRAYAEASTGNLLTAFNVEQSTLALLRGAELASLDGDNQAAAQMLGEFTTVWPNLGPRPQLAERVRKLQSALSTAP